MTRRADTITTGTQIRFPKIERPAPIRMHLIRLSFSCHFHFVSPVRTEHALHLADAIAMDRPIGQSILGWDTSENTDGPFPIECRLLSTRVRFPVDRADVLFLVFDVSKVRI